MIIWIVNTDNNYNNNNYEPQIILCILYCNAAATKQQQQHKHTNLYTYIRRSQKQQASATYPDHLIIIMHILYTRIYTHTHNILYAIYVHI